MIGWYYKHCQKLPTDFSSRGVSTRTNQRSGGQVIGVSLRHRYLAEFQRLIQSEWNVTFSKLKSSECVGTAFQTKLFYSYLCSWKEMTQSDQHKEGNSCKDNLMVSQLNNFFCCWWPFYQLYSQIKVTTIEAKDNT